MCIRDSNSSRRVLANAYTDEAGNLVQGVTIPADAEIGRHTVRVESVNGATITSLEMPVAVRTGLPVWLLAVAALSLASVVAALIVWVARRRRLRPVH